MHFSAFRVCYVCCACSIRASERNSSPVKVIYRSASGDLRPGCEILTFSKSGKRRSFRSGRESICAVNLFVFACSLATEGTKHILNNAQHEKWLIYEGRGFRRALTVGAVFDWRTDSVSERPGGQVQCRSHRTDGHLWAGAVRTGWELIVSGGEILKCIFHSRFQLSPTNKDCRHSF